MRVSVTANLVTKRLVFKAFITRVSQSSVRLRSMQRGSHSSFIASVDRRTYDGKARFFSCNQLLRPAFVSQMRPRLVELCGLLQLPHSTAAPGGMRVISSRSINVGKHVGTRSLQESWRTGLREGKTLQTEYMGNAPEMSKEAASAMPVQAIRMDKVSKALMLGSAPATTRAYRPQKPNQVCMQSDALGRLSSNFIKCSSESPHNRLARKKITNEMNHIDVYSYPYLPLTTAGF